MNSLQQPNERVGDSGGGGNGTVELFRKIEAGAVDPTHISTTDRRQLVSFLMGEGYSTADMSQILRVADRTIERDKKAIRESNAIVRDPKLVGQMVGRLVGEAELSIQRIRKVARDKEAAHATRIDGEHRCYQIISDLVRALQRLGYLPTAAQKVEADLTHHMGEVPDFPAIRSEVERLKQIHQQSNNASPEATRALCLLEDQIERADLASQVDDVSSTTVQAGVTNDESE
ncbi:MAG: hypothetical protein ACYTFA_01870 [Planctomycetota bacterium]|jgi:hypothetical protein